MISQLRQHRSKNFQSQIFFVSKAVSPSLDDTNFVVQSLDKSQRHFVLRSAVSRNTLPMTLNHLGKFLKRSEPLPFECCLPVLKEAPRPPFALIAPQLAKGLFEQVSDVEPLIGAQQGLQSLAAFQSEIVPVRQQRVFLSLDKASVFARKPTVFAFSHSIERLSQMTQHMKLVVENSRLRSTRFGSLSKRFPHVHHCQANPCALGLSQFSEKLRQAFFRAVLTAKPDWPGFLQVAHHNPIRVSFANRYLVDADHFRSWFSRLSQLRLHVLLVELFHRVPVQFEFPWRCLGPLPSDTAALHSKQSVWCKTDCPPKTPVARASLCHSFDKAPGVPRTPGTPAYRRMANLESGGLGGRTKLDALSRSCHTPFF